MPRGDGTGPLGEGPMTGLKRGRCAGNDSAGYFGGRGNGFGRGFGYGIARRGLGFGRGFRFNRMNESQADSEASLLENSINALRNQLKNLESRLASLRNKE